MATAQHALFPDSRVRACPTGGNGKLLRRLARANQFDVMGGVTQGEIDLLEPLAPGDRAYVVQTWIVRLMTNRLAAGGLAVRPISTLRRARHFLPLHMRCLDALSSAAFPVFL